MGGSINPLFGKGSSPARDKAFGRAATLHFKDWWYVEEIAPAWWVSPKVALISRTWNSAAEWTHLKIKGKLAPCSSLRKRVCSYWCRRWSKRFFQAESLDSLKRKGTFFRRVWSPKRFFQLFIERGIHWNLNYIHPDEWNCIHTSFLQELLNSQWGANKDN